VLAIANRQPAGSRTTSRCSGRHRPLRGSAALEGSTRGTANAAGSATHQAPSPTPAYSAHDDPAERHVLSARGDPAAPPSRSLELARCAPTWASRDAARDAQRTPSTQQPAASSASAAGHRRGSSLQIVRDTLRDTAAFLRVSEAQI
jgi:hypothetical protein